MQCAVKLNKKKTNNNKQIIMGQNKKNNKSESFVFGDSKCVFVFVFQIKR